ncbi:hypothetical protein AOLI_G00158080 [Acnodon oligacanthus]
MPAVSSSHRIMDLDIDASDDDLFRVDQHSSSQGSARPAPRLRSVVAVPDMPAASASSSSSSCCSGSRSAYSSSRRSQHSPPDPPPAPARSPRMPPRRRCRPLLDVLVLLPGTLPTLLHWLTLLLPPFRIQSQALLTLPRPLLANSSFSLHTAPPAVPPRDARLFNPPLISSALRARILQGANVSLSSLLHPSAACGAPRTIDTGDVSLTLKSADPRTSKVLTAPEFTLAFSIYRDVICSAFPSRRQELDDYLSILLDLAVHFGGSGFYDYHRLFSACASARLQ